MPIPTRVPLVLAVLSVLVAGCAKPTAQATDDAFVQEDSFDDYALDETPPELGVIRGVVLDAKLAPLAGVLIELVDPSQNGTAAAARNLTTGDDGVFAFRDVPPGAAFIKASLAGYETTQSSTVVAAGVQEPEVVKLLLQRIPGTEPYAVGTVWDGFIQCSVRIPAAGFNDGCGVYGNLGLGSSQRIEVVYEGQGMRWWQAEVTWDASSATSERLCADVSAATFAGGPLCGPSPVVQAMNRTHIEANDLEAQEPFEVVVYPDHFAADVSGNVVLQQGFRIVHYVFYNFAPPEGWTFAADGEPVPP